MARAVRVRGLSLVEVVVSSGILFLVMLLLLNLATTSIWGSKEGGERLAAETHAQSILEDYRARTFSSYPSDQRLELPTYEEDGTQFRCRLQAGAAPGAPLSLGPTLRQLVVTVSWSSTRGPKEVSLATYATPLLR